MVFVSVFCAFDLKWEFPSPCSTTPGKYGLQWQQPFLELVLACMKAQRTIHEELLAPLQKQLHNFLAAFEKVSQHTTSHW